MRFLYLLSLLRAALAIELVVPAYYRNASEWARIASAASKVRLTVISNSRTDPGSVPLYVDAVRAANGTAVAYVFTRYGARRLTEVKADIDRLLLFYTVDGFFVDQVGTKNSSLKYYQDLYKYIKGKNKKYTVILNPGTRVPEIYLKSKTGDRFVVFENTQEEYNNYKHQAYYKNYPRDTFIHFVHTAPASDFKKDIDFAIKNNISGIYVTNRSEADHRYLTLPSYWDQEVAYVKSK